MIAILVLLNRKLAKFMSWFARPLVLVLVLSPCLAEPDSLRLDQLKINGKNAVVATIWLSEGEPRLELYWKNENRPLKTYDALESWLASKKKALLFATNGGIYRDSPGLAPIGLHVEEGHVLSRLSFAKGCGNFCWYSGVFLVENNQASILPRENISARQQSGSRLALQSGPLFMRSGNLQGSWSRTSYNLNRSAVCTTNRTSELLLILVTDSTNFGEFFGVLKESGCHNALFLDGEVSSFYDGRLRKRLGNLSEPYAGMLAVTSTR